jgi:4-aminobutyrate aminotransferase-like enzyme
MQADSLLERRYRVLGRNSPLFYDKPLHLVRGDGVWLYDADGRRYLDAYNNVPHVGHCHPRVVAALSRQASILNIHTRYLDETVVAYAERLTALFDAQLPMAMFCCTGSEANENALKIAARRAADSVLFRRPGLSRTRRPMQVSSLFTSEKRGPNVRTVVRSADPYASARAKNRDGLRR